MGVVWSLASPRRSGVPWDPMCFGGKAVPSVAENYSPLEKQLPARSWALTMQHQLTKASTAHDELGFVPFMCHSCWESSLRWK